LLEFEKNLAPGTKEDLFLGTAFIVFEKPLDVYHVLDHFDDSPFSKFWRFLRRIFNCCGE